MNFSEFKLIAISDLRPMLERIEGNPPFKFLIVSMVSSQKTEDREFLARVLGAVQLTLESEVALLEIGPDELPPLSALINHTGATYILCFGTEAEQLGIRAGIQLYTPTLLNGCHYLFADSLSLIRETREKGDNKRAGALWTAIKQWLL